MVTLTLLTIGIGDGAENSLSTSVNVSSPANVNAGRELPVSDGLLDILYNSMWAVERKCDESFTWIGSEDFLTLFALYARKSCKRASLYQPK
jgi:hypothetical protein